MKTELLEQLRILFLKLRCIKAEQEFIEEKKREFDKPFEEQYLQKPFQGN